MFLMAVIPRKFIKIASKTVENYANFWWNKGELFLPFGIHCVVHALATDVHRLLDNSILDLEITLCLPVLSTPILVHLRL